MNHREALGVLGLDAAAEWSDVRTAYRGLIRVNHPDRAGNGATGRAAEITEAYAVLERTWGDAPLPPPAAHAPSGAREAAATTSSTAGRTTWAAGAWEGGAVEVLGGDTIALDADAEAAFFVMVDAAHDLGDVSFMDPSIGMVEAVFNLPGTPTCSLVATLQGRQDHVEVFCTIEALDGSPSPPVHGVVEVVADLIRQRIGSKLDRPVDAPAEWLVDENGQPGRRPDDPQRPTGTV